MARTASASAATVARQMPLNSPGSLSERQYLTIVAYVLERNGFAAGADDLTADDALRSTAPLAGETAGRHAARE